MPRRVFLQPVPPPSFRWPVAHEPRWSTASHRLAPPALRPWLGLRGSLTAALKQLSRGRFHVDVLRQYWGRPLPGESRALGIDPRALCLIREVVLFGNHQPWVFARSILPESALRGSLRRLRGLDNRPLGEILFADARIQRSAIEAAHITPQRSTLPTLRALTAEPLWGRRSVFALDRRRLLVAELFLPAFPCRERPSYNNR